MSNPYAAPASDLSLHRDDGPTYTPRMFTLSGRIGRVRYLAYCAGLLGIWCAIFLLGMLVAKFIHPLFGLLLAFLYLPLMFFNVVFQVRRLHDLDRSGWWTLLMLVPYLNIIPAVWLLFCRGSEGGNSHGPAPCANTRPLVWAAAAPVPVAIGLGIAAALMLPAYLGNLKQTPDRQEAQDAPLAAAEAVAGQRELHRSPLMPQPPARPAP